MGGVTIQLWKGWARFFSFFSAVHISTTTKKKVIFAACFSQQGKNKLFWYFFHSFFKNIPHPSTLTLAHTHTHTQKTLVMCVQYLNAILKPASYRCPLFHFVSLSPHPREGRDMRYCNYPEKNYNSNWRKRWKLVNMKIRGCTFKK